MSDSQESVLMQLETNLADWDGSSEQAMEIISKNQTLFDQWTDMLEGREKIMPSGNQADRMQRIIQRQRAVIHCLQEDKEQLQKRFKQLNQKNKVTDNYYRIQESSIFVDRNM
ncbi:hypothetical protein [Lacticigenium naphthae]|uniref:hypothetical protein n=1 Tax=Lacticigenium naphthae TaxID=515351 RepID=UPI0004019360|nr:hypothetical protein [Lacticigenium naphthae]